MPSSQSHLLRVIFNISSQPFMAGEENTYISLHSSLLLQKQNYHLSFSLYKFIIILISGLQWLLTLVTSLMHATGEYICKASPHHLHESDSPFKNTIMLTASRPAKQKRHPLLLFHYTKRLMQHTFLLTLIHALSFSPSHST